MQGVASQNAPAPNVVIPHFVFGGIILFTVFALIIFSPEALLQHYFNPKLLAMTHLLVLGWITMIIFGALYQLIPVILETKLYNETIAKITFLFLTVGTILLAISFWNFSLDHSMHIAGSVVLIAVALFSINIFLTAKKSEKKEIERTLILTSVTWLGFTATAGLVLAINLSNPFLAVNHIELLKLHAHAGIAGWFMQLIIGVGSRLLPMFMVSHIVEKKYLRASYYFLNVGLIIALVSLYLEAKAFVIIGAVFVSGGIFSFLIYLMNAYKHRVKKNLDIGMKQSAIAFLLLIVALLLLAIIFWQQVPSRSFSVTFASAYGSAIIVGFITALIMGQTYKTLPFIVWLKVYKELIGKGSIPMPKDLYWEAGAKMQLIFFIAGYFVLLFATLFDTETGITISALILLVSAALYNFNLLKIVFHKPKFETERK